MLPKSIRWRLVLAFAAIALLATVSLGAVLLSILSGYYAQREEVYLHDNAKAISATMTKIMSSGMSPEEIQSQIENLGFLAQTRIRVLDANTDVLYDSGNPSKFNIFLGVARARTARDELIGKDRTRSIQIITTNEDIKSQLGGEPPNPLDKIKSQVGREAQTKPVAAPEDPKEKDILFFKSLRVVGSPFGFALDSDLPLDGPRSNQIFKLPYDNPTGATQGFILLSDGPALGREILTSVALGWTIASIVAVLFAASVGWFISRRISAPVLALTNVTTRMAHGDLATRADVRGRDEFGQLAQSFNEMADRVETTIVMLRRFVSDAAHELGTPLTSLKGNLDLAADENDAAQRAQFLARAQSTVSRLEIVSRDLLDLSRLETHMAPSTQTYVDLAAVLRTNTEVYASRAEQAGLRFETVLPDPPIWIRGDAVQIQRALSNVIDNALKFTPTGGAVRVHVEQADEWIRAVISDTGIGIPHDDLPQLFERFHRGRNVAGYPGSGLGLAIVRAIMEQHHGRVTVENLSPGARFTLEWRRPRNHP